MLEATAIPTPTVAAPTLSPRGTLNLVAPVNFMQDPTNLLSLMLKCSTRQQLVCLCKLVCWLSQLSRTWFGNWRLEMKLSWSSYFKCYFIIHLSLDGFTYNLKPFNLTIISYCPIFPYHPTKAFLREFVRREEIRLPSKRLCGRLISATLKILLICTLASLI